MTARAEKEFYLMTSTSELLAKFKILLHKCSSLDPLPKLPNQQVSLRYTKWLSKLII